MMDPVRVLAWTLQADVEFDFTLGEGLAGGAVGTFLTTLIVGAIPVAVAPAHVEGMTETVLEEPVGSAIAFLAIAERLVDRGDDWLKPLLVAAAMNGGLALTGIGWIVGFAVGATGFGAVLHDRYG